MGLRGLWGLGVYGVKGLGLRVLEFDDSIPHAALASTMKTVTAFGFSSRT